MGNQVICCQSPKSHADFDECLDFNDLKAKVKTHLERINKEMVKISNLHSQALKGHFNYYIRQHMLLMAIKLRIENKILTDNKRSKAGHSRDNSSSVLSQTTDSSFSHLEETSLKRRTVIKNKIAPTVLFLNRVMATEDHHDESDLAELERELYTKRIL